MRGRAWLMTGLATVMAAGVVCAQEAPESAEPREKENRTERVREIRVLQHPYDIASFYRSSQSQDAGYFGASVGAYASERYPIAGFYRSQQSARPFGYSRFWTSGYGYGSRVRSAASLGHRRRIGQNGDIFLFAPTILAPVGPLTDAFNR